MTTQSTVTTGQKIGVIALSVFFLALGGFFGYLFYSALEIFAQVYDPIVRNICIAAGVAVTALIMVAVMRRGVRRERERNVTSGGTSSDTDFMSLFWLSTIASGDSGWGSDSGSHGGGWFGGHDSGGGGWGGGDSGGGFGGDSGGGSF